MYFLSLGVKGLSTNFWLMCLWQNLASAAESFKKMTEERIYSLQEQVSLWTTT